ncbi:hypothetical protein TWF102_002269 [Orbilia oligospora]|uniref:Uncharacterized protein n=1 Tax=Orbilia oligospora TaxID=2813651 RepID=A0A7C8JV11_ORBOL|nr:hypothetical protein TWF706_002064 [Orbilia oligospora]KAF3099667.1 hypothetical protein TWF103_008753 [Orbilia oligospora]KAF3105340.1 hypothetical protein TWF102_002269 [Orbilia oligospora]KAF3133378.1 hypothetical protein TWF703_006917 [Orbilia oligospora]
MNTSTSASPQPSALGRGPPKFTVDTGMATVLVFFALVSVGGFLMLAEYKEHCIKDCLLTTFFTPLLCCVIVGSRFFSAFKWIYRFGETHLWARMVKMLNYIARSQTGDEEEGLESNSRNIRDSIEMKDMGESTLNEGSSSNALTP